MPIKRYFDRAGRETPASEAIDARGAIRDGFRMSEHMADGETVSFSMAFMDAAPRTSLRDTAGQPITLYDRASGGQLKLNTDLIAAIEAEAAKLRMSVPTYVEHVLKYSWSAAHLAGNGSNAGRPGEKETN